MVRKLNLHAGIDHNIKIGNNSFETMEQLRYLETKLTNQIIPFIKKLRADLSKGTLATIR
jgi:hypothetical protein